MEKMNYWRLSDEFSVVQAALLIVDLSPEEFPYVLAWEEYKQPVNFTAILSALSHGIRGERLPAFLHDIIGTNALGEVADGKRPDWSKTTTKIEDLKKWLSM